MWEGWVNIHGEVGGYGGGWKRWMASYFIVNLSLQPSIKDGEMAVSGQVRVKAEFW